MFLLCFRSKGTSFTNTKYIPNRLWMVSVRLILNGSPWKIVQRGQITDPRRPLDIRISADYSISENCAQKIDCYVGCVARGPVLFEPNVVHVVHVILFNIWKQKFVEHGTVRLPVAVIWMMLCIILKWKGSIFLIKPYFWKNIHKFVFYSRFKFEMLDGITMISLIGFFAADCFV